MDLSHEDKNLHEYTLFRRKIMSLIILYLPCLAGFIKAENTDQIQKEESVLSCQEIPLFALKKNTILCTFFLIFLIKHFRGLLRKFIFIAPLGTQVKRGYNR
jgi:hypothetical protein